MQLLVLAAGSGKRIKPIVTSKPLLPFLGRTLLGWVIESCQVLKPRQTVIVVNPQDQPAVKKLFPMVRIAVQPKPTGMAQAVLAARRVLAGPTVVVNADDLLDAKIILKFSQKIKANPDKVILSGIKSRPGLTGGYFDLRGESLQVVEKPAKAKPWLKLVLDYFPQIEAFIDILASTPSTKDDVYEQSLNRLKNLTLVKASGSFYPIKFPWQILDLTAGLLKGKAIIHKTATVFPGACVINSYIGPKVVIGHNSLVRDSIIEEASVVGYSTEICRSYVGPGNYFHSNYIGDSVIEAGSNFGAGAVLANWRFDHKPIGRSNRTKFGAVVGKAAKVGVNASVMPGAMIASGELVWPGAVRK